MSAIAKDEDKLAETIRRAIREDLRIPEKCEYRRQMGSTTTEIPATSKRKK